MNKPTDIVTQLINNWNTNNFEGCAALFSDNIELRSTNLAKLFPESGGVINGRETVINYMQVVNNKMPDLKFKIICVDNKDQGAVLLESKANNGLNVYMLCYVNESEVIYKIKSDVSSPD